MTIIAVKILKNVTLLKEKLKTKLHNIELLRMILSLKFVIIFWILF